MSSKIPVHSQKSYLCSLLICRKWNHNPDALRGSLVSKVSARALRQMWKDPRLKKICDIEADEPPYGIAVLSRFRTKVGPEKLSRIVDQAVEVLVAKGRIKGEALALDSTFIKA